MDIFTQHAMEWTGADYAIQLLFGTGAGAAVNPNEGIYTVRNYGKNWEVSADSFAEAIKRALKQHPEDSTIV